jgi:hypothetical protein
VTGVRLRRPVTGSGDRRPAPASGVGLRRPTPSPHPPVRRHHLGAAIQQMKCREDFATPMRHKLAPASPLSEMAPPSRGNVHFLMSALRQRGKVESRLAKRRPQAAWPCTPPNGAGTCPSPAAVVELWGERLCRLRSRGTNIQRSSNSVGPLRVTGETPWTSWVATESFH